MLKKTNETLPPRTTSQISAPRFAIVSVPIRNAPGSPLPNLARIKLAQLAADIGRARERLRAFRSFIPDDLADDIDTALKRAEERATPAAAVQAVAS